MKIQLPQVLILLLIVCFTLKKCVGVKKVYRQPLKFRYSEIDQETSASHSDGIITLYLSYIKL